MSAETEFEVPSWRQIYSMLLSMAGGIRRSGFKPDVIVGVLRGGWLPARVLSDFLGVGVDSVGVEFYLGVAETRKAPVLTQSVSVPVTGKRVLVVDDVADSGESLTLVKAHVLQKGAKEVRVATVYCKPWSVVKPEYYARESSCWVVFPWELKETIRKIVEKCSGRAEVDVAVAKLVKAGAPKHLAAGFLKELFEEQNC